MMFRRGDKSGSVKVFEVTPYSALAEIYDQVMSHVDYARWARHLLRLAKLHGMRPRRVLDISCGTGRLCREFYRKGLDVLGCDASVPMLRVAVANADAAAKTHYWCATMERSAVRGPIDMAISSYDSMNYLHSPDDWLKVLHHINRVLTPGGLFIFDVSTIRNSQEVFAEYSHQEKFFKGSYWRQSLFDPHTCMQYYYFEIELSNNPGCLYKEVHSQTIRTLGEIQSIIAKSAFVFLAHYADFGLRQGSEEADRVHFVLQKTSLK